MSHVIIVSNRLPVSVKKVDGELIYSVSMGGLATGLSSYVKDGKSVWVGWPGIPREDLTEPERQQITVELAKQQCAPVFLNKNQIELFYNGYSNKLLWPICHDLPLEHSEIPKNWWKAYREVNKLFAEVTLGLTRPTSTIWVHDYQLLLLPQLLRAEHAGGHIGFFLHIPFPDTATWQRVKESSQLITGMLGADLVGFHTTGYSHNFIDNCEAIKLEHEVGGILVGSRHVKVSNFPIGVDYEKYAAGGKLKAVRKATKVYKKKYGKRKIIVAIDRLEPSKGLVERLHAYDMLLKANPKLHNKVVMVMVAALSRMEIAAYQNLKIELEKTASKINNKYGTARWQPVNLVTEPQPFENVNALYQIADVAFIAPLKDGMNLVAKEYVASKRKSGVLVLSETAGAAEELRDALLVNPLLPHTVVDALQRALSMPKPELRSRLKNMQTTTASNTIHTWANGFVKALQKPVPGTRPITRTLQGRSMNNMVKDYRTSSKRLILLDYDGSLIPLQTNYAAAKPSKKLMGLLEILVADPRNTVVVVSGRTADDLDRWLDKLPINLVAEHGAFIKKTGGKWLSQTSRETQWKRTILPILDRYTKLTPGARVENKPHSLVWHYRAATPYYAQKYAVIIKKLLKPLLKKYGVAIIQGNKILEIKDPRVSKGSGISRWVAKPHNFVMIVGDDLTDEDMFKVAPEMAYTVKVGRGLTFARYRVADSTDVQYILGRFTKQVADKTDTRVSRVRLPLISR